MTATDVRHRLHAALRAMAGLDTDYAREQNGVGFSRVDGDLGHRLAESDPERWTPRQTHAAWKIAQRYKNTQLALFNIDEIPEPELPVVVERIDDYASSVVAYPPSRIGVDRDRLVFAWPYGEPDFYIKKDLVRAIPGRTWNQDAKVWTAPITQASIGAVAALVNRFATAPSPFEVDEDVYAAVDDVAERLAKNIEDSHAADADHEVPGLRMDLFPFQRAGVRFLGRHKKVILGDQMGLGKTPMAIAAIVDNDAWPALVIVPASLKLNWKREFQRWVDLSVGTNNVKPGYEHLGNLIIQVAEGTKTIGLMEPLDVLIINYDILEAWQTLLEEVSWGAIVCDEAHYLKTPKAKRTKAVKHIVKQVRPDYLFLLTGTPFLSRPIEGWSLIDLIGHGTSTFGGWGQYTEMYCDKKVTRFGIDVSGASNVAQLNATLRSSGAYIRRKKEDVLKELPPRRWATVPLEMAPVAAREYQKAEMDLKGYLAQERSLEREREQAWEREAELAFAATDPAAPIGPWVDAYIDAQRREYRKSEEARLAQSEHLVRFEALKQLAYKGKKAAVFGWIDTFLESGQKLIVFANHREVVLEIAAKYNAPTIMGGMKPEEVEAGKNRFQNDPGVRVIVCNIRAGGVGHTLTAASDVAFVELGWTPADMDQALDRAHRIGQTESVTGWVLAAQLPDGSPTIDGEVASILERKRAIVERASDGDGVVEQLSVIDELARRLNRGAT